MQFMTQFLETWDLRHIVTLNVLLLIILSYKLFITKNIIGTSMTFILRSIFSWKCFLPPSTSASSVAVSAWTLVAISCERYYAICHPLSSRRWQTLKHAYKLIGLIWFGSFLFMSPIAALSRLIPTSQGKFFFVVVVISKMFYFYFKFR